MLSRLSVTHVWAHFQCESMILCVTLFLSFLVHLIFLKKKKKKQSAWYKTVSQTFFLYIYLTCWILQTYSISTMQIHIYLKFACFIVYICVKHKTTDWFWVFFPHVGLLFLALPCWTLVGAAHAGLSSLWHVWTLEQFSLNVENTVLKALIIFLTSQLCRHCLLVAFIKKKKKKTVYLSGTFTIFVNANLHLNSVLYEICLFIVCYNTFFNVYLC